MSLSSNAGAKQYAMKSQSRVRLATFPLESTLTTSEEMQRFELLRLAFFFLKLRKLRMQMSLDGEAAGDAQESAFRLNLLRHVIFKQMLTLTRLDAREQAMQIISVCHKQ